MKRFFLTGAVLISVIFAGYLASCSSSDLEVGKAEKTKGSFQPTKPKLKVFLENSGSMDGYMCDGSDLKDAVYDYLSDLNGCTDTMSLNYINSQVIPYENDLESYIKNLNPISFKNAGGNRSNSDLSSCIKTVLNETNDNTVGMFISDCILDLTEANANKLLTNCKITIKNAINEKRKKVTDLGVIVVKMTSDFNGKYFYADGGEEELSNVERPYYIWLFGDKKHLRSIMENAPLEDLSKYGFKEYVAFANIDKVDFEIGSKKNIKYKKIKSNKGKFEAIINVDFKSTLQPDSVLTTINNYEITDKSIKIESIKSTKEEYTHNLRINIPEECTSTKVAVTLKRPDMPKWVKVTNDETGNNIKKNIDKTTGIKHLIDGVAESYEKENVAELILTLKK